MLGVYIIPTSIACCDNYTRTRRVSYRYFKCNLLRAQKLLDAVLEHGKLLL